MARRKARKKVGDPHVGDQNTDGADAPENISKVQADHSSVAISGISIGGDLSGEVNIAAGNIYKGFTAEQVSVLLTQISSTFQHKPFDGRCPYKGLEVFEEEDAELFFGRERTVDDLVNRVKESRTVFITGPSGSGKSSLVRAGLIHKLKQGAIKTLHSERWLYATMKPGREPMIELARVASSIAGTLNAGEDILSKGWMDASILEQWFEVALGDGAKKRAVVFIDQFEEIFTQISKEEERLAFLNLLTYAATSQDGRLIILIAMRSDFVSNCAGYPELNAILNQQFVQIGAMQPDELVSAIAEPALRVDLRIAPDLIAQIVNDMHGEPGTLPLMQFALKDLFDSRQEQGIIALTLKDYLQRGGIRKSLERHAASAFFTLNEHEQELARSIFGGLIEIGRGTEDTSRTAFIDELIPASSNITDVEVVVQKLADARLIITDEQAGKDTIKLVHEKLIDAWPWLKRLVNENREVIALRNEMMSDAKEWDEHHRDVSYLYRGARLISVCDNLETQKLVLSGITYDFVQFSIDVYNEEIETLNREQTRKKRLQRQIISGLIVFTAAILVLLAFVLIQLDTLRAQRLSSQGQAAFAEQKYNIALLYAYQSNQIHKNNAADFVLSQIISKNFAEGRQLAGHNSPVVNVVWSADGRLASRSQDNTIIIWDLEAGRSARTLNGIPANVKSLAWSRDGHLASGLEDGTVIIWDLKTGQPARTLKGSLSNVESLAWSRDGHLASGFGNGTVIIWDLKTGQPARTLKRGNLSIEGHTSSVEGLAWSADGRLASGSWDNTVIIWDLTSGQPAQTLKAHTAAVTSVAWSADGELASGSNDHTVIIWDLTTGQPAQTFEDHTDAVTSVAWSADGQLASGSNDHTVIIWDLTTGQPAQTLEGHTDAVSSVAWSADRRLASGSRDSTVIVWDLRTGQTSHRLKKHLDAVTSVAWSTDGRLASGSKDHTVIIWDLETGQPTQILKRLSSSIESLAWSQDGRLASGLGDNTVIIWDLETGRPAQTLEGHSVTVPGLAWSADGRLASGSWDKTVIIWDLKTGRPAQTLKGPPAQVSSVAWSADGRLASGSWDKTVIIWDLKTGRPAQTLKGHTDVVTSLAWSADGRLASGSWDHTVIIWDLKTGQPAQTLKAHTAQVSSVAWSADGHLASGSNDRTVIIWDIKTGQPAQILKGHTAQISSVAWSADGRLASGSLDKLIKTARASLVTNPCRKIIRNLTVEEWLSYLGVFAVYQPTCPNLPVPTINPVNELIFRRNIWNALLQVLITWKGRMILLVSGLMLYFIVRGVSWLLYQSMLYDYNREIT